MFLNGLLCAKIYVTCRIHRVRLKNNVIFELYLVEKYQEDTHKKYTLNCHEKRDKVIWRINTEDGSITLKGVPIGMLHVFARQ